MGFYLSRRQLMAMIPAAGLAGCGKDTPIVNIVYKPIVNFNRLWYGPLPANAVEAGPGRMFSMVEIVRIENQGATALPFAFNSAMVQLKDGIPVAGFLPYLKDLILGSAYQGTIPAGSVQTYPKPQPVLSGSWCQTLQHLRLIFSQKVDAPGDQHVLGNMTYTMPADAKQGVVMGRQQPIADIPYYQQLDLGVLINTVLKGSFTGSCGGTVENPGGGSGNGPGAGGSSGGSATQQPYVFCVTAPGSGVQKQEIVVFASSAEEARSILVSQNLPNGEAGWKIMLGKCA